VFEGEKSLKQKIEVNQAWAKDADLLDWVLAIDACVL
jgi:hypothetical protein